MTQGEAVHRFRRFTPRTGSGPQDRLKPDTWKADLKSSAVHRQIIGSPSMRAGARGCSLIWSKGGVAMAIGGRISAWLVAGQGLAAALALALGTVLGSAFQAITRPTPL